MTAETQFVPAPVKNTVSHADVDKLDVRVGMIERVEDVPKSYNLLKLLVNFGDHTRQILVGMKGERAKPKWEFPRLCRGGSKSLTYQEVHRRDSDS